MGRELNEFDPPRPHRAAIAQPSRRHPPNPAAGSLQRRGAPHFPSEGDESVSRRRVVALTRAGSALAVLLGRAGESPSARPDPGSRPELQVRLHWTITDHGAVVWDVAFNRTGEYLATCSADGTVKRWSWRDRALVRTFVHPEGVTAMAFSPDGRWLASCGEDRTVHLWQLLDRP